MARHSMRLERSELEKLRDRKSRRGFYRLKSRISLQHEFRRPGCGPSTYALVHFDCRPAEDLGFESRAEWPAEALAEKDSFELAIAEAITDALLAGLYQHSGCTISLAKVGYDAVGSSVIAFTKATERAMQDFLGREQDWEFVAESATNG